MKKKDKPQSGDKNTMSNKDNKNIDKLSKRQQNTKGDDNMELVREMEKRELKDKNNYVAAKNIDVLNAINRSHRKHKKMMRKLAK